MMYELDFIRVIFDMNKSNVDVRRKKEYPDINFTRILKSEFRNIQTDVKKYKPFSENYYKLKFYVN